MRDRCGPEGARMEVVMAALLSRSAHATFVALVDAITGESGEVAHPKEDNARKAQRTAYAAGPLRLCSHQSSTRGISPRLH